MKFTILAVVAICVLSYQHVHGATIVQTLGQAASGVASNIAANSGTILKNAEIAAGTVAEVGGSVVGVDINNLAASSESGIANLGLVGVLGQAASGVAQNIAANSGTILKNAEIAAGTVAEVGGSVLGVDINNLAASSESGTANLGLVGVLGQAASGVAQNIAANSGTILKNSIISAGTVAEIGAGVLGNDIKNAAQELKATNANVVTGLVGTLTNVASNIADGAADQAPAGIVSASGALSQAAGNIVKNAEIGAGTVIKVGAGILGI